MTAEAMEELRSVLDTLEDAVDAIRHEIRKLDEGPPTAIPMVGADEIILYGEQNQILYRAVRVRNLLLAVDWPHGIAGSSVRGLSVTPL